MTLPKPPKEIANTPLPSPPENVPHLVDIIHLMMRADEGTRGLCIDYLEKYIAQTLETQMLKMIGENELSQPPEFNRERLLYRNQLRTELRQKVYSLSKKEEGQV